MYSKLLILLEMAEYRVVVILCKSIIINVNCWQFASLQKVAPLPVQTWIWRIWRCFKQSSWIYRIKQSLHYIWILQYFLLYFILFYMTLSKFTVDDLSLWIYNSDLFMIIKLFISSYIFPVNVIIKDGSTFWVKES